MKRKTILAVFIFFLLLGINVSYGESLIALRKNIPEKRKAAKKEKIIKKPSVALPASSPLPDDAVDHRQLAEKLDQILTTLKTQPVVYLPASSFFPPTLLQGSTVPPPPPPPAVVGSGGGSLSSSASAPAPAPPSPPSLDSFLIPINYALNYRNFNGVNHFVNLGNPLNLQITGAVTFEVWVKPAASENPFQYILAKGNDDFYSTVAYQLSLINNRLYFKVSNGTAFIVRAGTTDLPIDQWSHIVAVYEPSKTLSLYVNGALHDGVREGAIPGALLNPDIRFFIGAQDRTAVPRYFKGSMHDLRIYNRTLTPEEIGTRAAGLSPPSP